MSRSRAVALAAVLVLLLVTACSADDDEGPDSAMALLDGLERYLAGEVGDRNRLAGEDRAALAELAELRANVAALEISDLRLEPSGPSATPPPATLADQVVEVLDVEVTWRVTGHDATASQVVVPLVVERTGAAMLFRTARVDGTRAPSWLLGPLAVHRTEHALVAAAEAPTGRTTARTTAALAERAVQAVRLAVPEWVGTLVVEVPATANAYAAAAGLSTSEGQTLVAVTTTADGSRREGAGLRVLLHPALLAELGPRAQQAVLTHEAVHVALASPLRPVPPWLAEGLADHVAITQSGIPVRDAAAEAIALVRRDGLPEGLPEPEALTDPDDGGGSYEASWLVVRHLVRQHGQAAVLDLVAATARGDAPDEALRAVLGVTEAEVVRGWRAELARLAGQAP